MSDELENFALIRPKNRLICVTWMPHMRKLTSEIESIQKTEKIHNIGKMSTLILVKVDKVNSLVH